MKAMAAILLVIFACGCGGSLSEDQRRQMHEKMEMNRIVRVTEVEITEAAFAEGRKIIRTLGTFGGEQSRIDSFLRVNHGRIRFTRPGAQPANALEQQLLEAYLADTSGSFQDNVQKARNEGGGFDSLLYTKPVTTKLSDGREQLEGVWNIWLPKKALVMEIGKNR